MIYMSDGECMGNTAKYRQVTEWINNRILSGELSGGDKIESENEISSLFGISRQTVRHALRLLIAEGILEAHQGSGTYVKKKGAVVDAQQELSGTVTIISTYLEGYIFPMLLQSMV